MIPVNPLPKSRQDNKEKIFFAAARLFAERGFDGVSMRELSEKTGLSKPTIYYYFGNKEGIYKALVDAGINVGVSRIDEISQSDLPVKQRLIDIVKTHFYFAREFPELTIFFQTMFITSAEKHPFLSELIEQAKGHRQKLALLIQEGIAKGEFGASADPKLACDLFIGAVTHFIWKQLNNKKKILTDQLAEQIVELLFKGLNE